MLLSCVFGCVEVRKSLRFFVRLLNGETSTNKANRRDCRLFVESVRLFFLSFLFVGVFIKSLTTRILLQFAVCCTVCEARSSRQRKQTAEIDSNNQNAYVIRSGLVFRSFSKARRAISADLQG
jgi:hypothetical protein